MNRLTVIRKARPALNAVAELMQERDEMIALYQGLPRRIREKQNEIDRLTAPQHAGPMLLSRREREVLELVLCELSNKEIGSELHVTERTVKFHVSRLLMKYGKTNRKGLLR